MIYLNGYAKFVISIESLGNGDGSILKLLVTDIKTCNSQDMVIHLKEDSTYSLLENANSSILISEERINLFRAAYGVYQSEIDFSTYKFRLQAQPLESRDLL